MSNTYWNESGKNQAIYNELCDSLIPTDLDGVTSIAPTIAGELLRAVTHVYYDGSQCNSDSGVNLTGSVNYLIQNLPENNPISNDLLKLTKITNHYVSDKSRDIFCEMLESVMNYVIVYVSNMNMSLVNEVSYEDLYVHVSYEIPDIEFEFSDL